MSRFGLSLTYSKFGFAFKLSGVLRNMSDTASGISNDGTSKKRSLQEDSDGTDPKKQRIETDRVKRRKIALLMAYSGQGYLGMQRNPGMKTIEEDLLTALLKAGFVTEEAFNTPQLIQFQRAARTDKGVSAARQVVSIKLPEDTKVELINDHLPVQIRVLAIKRTTKGFNSKSTCDARTYSYMLPTFAFAPSNVEPSESYRITSEAMEDVKTTLKVFEGTHNFHNFTARKKPLDPSANRYIMNFEVGEPFVSKDIEFSVLQVKGQSFMLHQIRKMVGLTIAVARGLAAVDTIHKAWKMERLDLPVAPGLGLVLEEVHYDRYNQRFGKDGIHEPLDWSEVDASVRTFKETFIYPTIIESEIEEKSYPFCYVLLFMWHRKEINQCLINAIVYLELPETSATVGTQRDPQIKTVLKCEEDFYQLAMEEFNKRCRPVSFAMLNWLQTLPLHSYSIREDNLSHGLTTLGQAADLLEQEEDGDGLATLARAAQAVQEGQNILYNGNPNKNVPST